MSNNNIQSTNNLSIASLILSISSVVLGPFGCIPGIICGHLAIKEYKKSNITSGTGMAKAGLWIGYIALVIMVLTIILTFMIFYSIEPAFESTY